MGLSIDKIVTARALYRMDLVSREGAMDIWEAIEKRRSIRRFAGPATEEQLRKIILAGTRAPSGGNRQGWRVIIAREQPTKEALARLAEPAVRPLHRAAARRREPLEPGCGITGRCGDD